MIVVDIFIWASEMVFGRIVSSQIRSRREDADFGLLLGLYRGSGGV